MTTTTTASTTTTTITTTFPEISSTSTESIVIGLDSLPTYDGTTPNEWLLHQKKLIPTPTRETGYRNQLSALNVKRMDTKQIIAGLRTFVFALSVISRGILALIAPRKICGLGMHLQRDAVSLVETRDILQGIVPKRGIKLEVLLVKG